MKWVENSPGAARFTTMNDQSLRYDIEREDGNELHFTLWMRGIEFVAHVAFWGYDPETGHEAYTELIGLAPVSLSEFDGPHNFHIEEHGVVSASIPRVRAYGFLLARAGGDE